MLVAGGLPQKLCTENVDGTAGQQALAVLRRIHIRQIDGQEGVVVADGGTQQHGLLLVQPQSKAREMPAFRMEQAELRRAEIFNISVSIEYCEGVSALEHTRAVVRQCGGSADVIFVGDPDYVRQYKSVLKCECI